MKRKTNLITRIRRYWIIKPFTRVKKSKKLYDRKKAKQALNKKLQKEQ